MLDARRVTAADERLRIKFSDIGTFFRNLGEALFGGAPALSGQASVRSRRIETILRRPFPS